MELNDYQKQALTTCMPSCNNFAYMFINLVGELGEMASKVAKLIRKEEASVIHDKIYITVATPQETQETREALKGELGDILWQLSGLCHTFGLSLEDVAQYNLDKLASRHRRGVIDGNGDNR